MDEHTANNPYCNNPGCWCHTDVSYHAEVTEMSTQADDDMTFIAGQTLNTCDYGYFSASEVAA